LNSEPLIYVCGYKTAVRLQPTFVGSIHDESHKACLKSATATGFLRKSTGGQLDEFRPGFDPRQHFIFEGLDMSLIDFL